MANGLVPCMASGILNGHAAPRVLNSSSEQLISCPQGLYWTLPKDRVEELEDMESEEEEEEQGHHDSAAALVEGSVHGDKPEAGSGGGGGERGQSLVSLVTSI